MFLELYPKGPLPIIKEPGFAGVKQPSIPKREDLMFLEGTSVECSGRVKEFRAHVKRKDLDSLLLVNMIVTPIPFGESIYIEHMWFLKRQFKKIGKIPMKNERINFFGQVYSYKRLGGKSIDRGLYGTEDYGISPSSYLQ